MPMPAIARQPPVFMTVVLVTAVRTIDFLIAYISEIMNSSITLQAVFLYTFKFWQSLSQ